MNPDTQKNYGLKIGNGGFFRKVMRIFIVKEKNEIPVMACVEEDQELIENIKNAKKEWINANINFEYADDKELVDYYTYKIKACQVRYEYYIKKAKEKGLKIELLDKTEVICKGEQVNF